MEFRGCLFKLPTGSYVNSVNITIMYSTTLPPSSKTVLEILDAGGAMTHKDLVQKTHLAPRTVRYALKKLKERHLIIEKFNFRDARQIIYQNRTIQTNKPQPACV